ncbi:beta-lactamase/transpeptidase-like protein [Nemania abortiva]|nr:beta-lactamase/transpeptidase-like protein [Nemania abortiva]
MSRLEAAMSKIESVQKLCRAPSVSVGVLHQGEVVFRRSVGLRDVEANLEADSDTAYQIGSCSKLFTSAAVGLLSKGQPIWKDKVHDHLPEFDPIQDRCIGKTATIADLCRNSTGLANPNAIFLGPRGTTVVKGEDHITMVNKLPTSNEHGQRFNNWWYYSNAAFGLLADVVKKSSGAQFATFLKDRVCSPLGLSQTLLTEADVVRNTNVAHPYVQRIDGTWARIDNEYTTEKYGPVLATIGIRTSVNDMLAFFAAVMNRYDLENESTPSPELLAKCQGNPLREISSMWNSWWTRPCEDGFENDTAYTLGWFRTTMPTSALGMLSYNSVHRKEDIIGKESDSRTLYGHNGISNGFVATAYLIPDSHTAVVALSNTADAGDASETASQILLQAIFDLKPQIDLLPSLEASIADRLRMHKDMVKDWREHRDVSQYDEAVSEEFLGTYVGFGVSYIHIIHSDTSLSRLAVRFADQEASQCDLEPYNKDALSFLPLDHHEKLERGMIDWDYWQVGVFTLVREGMTLDLNVPTSKADSPPRGSVADDFTGTGTQVTESETKKPVVGLRWKWDEFDQPGLWIKSK